MAPNVPNDLIELGMEQWFAPTDGDDRCTQFSESVHTAQHHCRGDRLGEIVVLVAIATGQIAAPHRNDMRDNGVVARMERPGHHADLPELPRECTDSPLNASSNHRRTGDDGEDWALPR